MCILLATHLSPSDPFDMCCLAVACCTMWAQLCLSEILSQWETSFTPSKVVCRHHLAPPFNANGSQICHLPFAKVAKSKGEDVCICCQSDTSDPIAALENHLRVNNPPANIPLFSYLSLWGWRCLSKKKLLTCCNSIWLLVGIPFSSGHSFCIGGTTELLLSGVPLNVVKSLGQYNGQCLSLWNRIC